MHQIKKEPNSDAEQSSPRENVVQIRVKKDLYELNPLPGVCEKERPQRSWEKPKPPLAVDSKPVRKWQTPATKQPSVLEYSLDELIDFKQAPRRASVFDRLDGKPKHQERSQKFSKWNNNNTNYKSAPRRTKVNIQNFGVSNSTPMISVQNYMLAAPSPAATYNEQAWSTHSRGLPCSSELLRSAYNEYALHGLETPAKYDMMVQKEIAKLQSRPFYYSSNPAKVITENGSGVEDLYVVPRSTSVTFHKRFA